MQVFSTEESIRRAIDKIAELRERYKNVAVQDKGKRYNLDLLEGMELGYLLDIAEAMSVAALHRPESRGGRSEEHTSELQSRGHIVCRLLLEKKNDFLKSPIKLKYSLLHNILKPLNIILTLAKRHTVIDTKQQNIHHQQQKKKNKTRTQNTKQ